MGGIFADAGKSSHFTDLARKSPTMWIQDELCRRVEISCSGVITEPLPAVENIIFGCARECLEVRKPAQPFSIIRENRRHLGLLKHELGDENAVWIASMAPRKVTTVTLVPSQ